LSWLIGAVVACSLTGRPAKADLWVANDNSAEADFSISGTVITIKVTNLLSPTAIVGAGTAVSGVVFTLSNNAGANGANTASGQLVNLDSSGNVTDQAGSPNNWITPTKGLVTSATSPTVTISAFSTSPPTEMILPADNGGGYPNSNNSINANHQPSVDGPLTVTLTLAGLTTLTTIQSVTFEYGTMPDSTQPGTDHGGPLQLQAVPEPSTLVIGVVGALGFFGYGLRRRFAR
jgi:hypothetical protein